MINLKKCNNIQVSLTFRLENQCISLQVASRIINLVIRVNGQLLFYNFTKDPNSCVDRHKNKGFLKNLNT